MKAYGLADLEFDVPTPPDASYDIMSITKQFTAAAILLLAERGRLTLDDEITRFLVRIPDTQQASARGTPGFYSCRTHVPRVTESLAHEHAERVLALKPFA
jgi:hypothetical protein